MEHPNNEKLSFCMEKAWEASEEAVCFRKKVGAVLLNTYSGVIISTGYGGAKLPCKECVKKTHSWTQDGCWSIHAEVRALFNYFEIYGFDQDLSHCAMVVTHGPCDQCLKYMDFFNIPVVYYDKQYKTDYSKWEGKIEVVHAPFALEEE